MAVIRRAIGRREVLRLTYQSRHREPGVRDVEPHGLICVAGRWIMAAYCRERQAMRHFRLDRIDALLPTGERFTRRADFTVRTLAAPVSGPVEVRVLVAPPVVRWAREERPLGFAREEEHERGTVMVFRPRDENDLIPWVLSWGALAEVLSPETLRHRFAAHVRSIAALYHDTMLKNARDRHPGVMR